MHVLYCHRLDEPAGGGHYCLAAIDLQLNPDVRLYGLRLLRMRDGKHLLFAPQSGRRRVATFSLPLAKALTEVALQAYEAAQ